MGVSTQVYPDHQITSAKPAEPSETLTARERQVLLLTAEGLTSKEIAGRLGISPRTADVHRAHVIQKLGLRNRVEAVRYALTTGMVPWPTDKSRSTAA
jgi:DNA-binding CsgD family transcriptional regulator